MVLSRRQKAHKEHEVKNMTRQSNIKSASEFPIDPVTAFLASLRSSMTRRAYGNDLKDLARFIGVQPNKDLLTLEPENIVAYRDSLIKRGQASLTTGRKMTTIRRMFDYCITRGWVQYNPANKLLVQAPRRMVMKRTQGLTRNEASLLLQSIHRESVKDTRDYALLLVMLYHGLRRSEVAALKTSSIGSERGYVTLRIIGKYDKARIHPMQPDVLNAITEYLKADGRSLAADGPLFRSTRSAAGLSTETVNQVVVERCKRAGIQKHVSAHGLRCTAITTALDAGSSLRRVSEFAGHASIQTTLSYDLNRESLIDNAAHQILYR